VNTESFITKALVEILREQFLLDWQGIHGAPHWARVRRNGLSLSGHTGANVRVVEYFAFLHDCRREHDGHDLEHGHRAAEFAFEIRADYLRLDDAEFELLLVACRGHSDGGLEADVTVQTCWDADRLDLGRVGIVPCPTRLCTAAARADAVIDAAYRRSLTV
jgi:uncharacterized protein